MSPEFITRTLPSPSTQGSNREVQQYDDPNMSRVVFMVGPQEVKNDPGPRGRIRDRLRESRHQFDAQGNYIVFSGEDGIFAELHAVLKAGFSPVVELRLSHPAQSKIMDSPSQLAGLQSLAVITYRDREPYVRGSIIPINKKERNMNKEEKIVQIRALLAREQTLAEAGITLQGIDLPIGIMRNADEIFGIHEAPVQIVVPEGRQSKADHAMELLIDMLYPDKTQVGERESVNNLLEKLNIRREFEAREGLVIQEYSQNEQDEFGLPAREVVNTFPGGEDDILNDVLRSLRVRSEMWARRYALDVGFGEDNFTYSTGISDQSRAALYGTEIDVPLAGEYGYKYIIDKKQDNSGQDILAVTVFVDKQVMCTFTFQAHIDVPGAITKVTNRNEGFADLAGMVTYTDSPLASVN